MTRPERLLLLGFFAAVLVLVARGEPTATAVGAVAGLLAGVAVAGRVGRLRTRMDARIGADDAPATGLRVRRPATRAALHLAVLAALLVTTVVVPFVGDELFAASAAAVTALPAVLTAARLRR